MLKRETEMSPAGKNTDPQAPGKGKQDARLEGVAQGKTR